MPSIAKAIPKAPPKRLHEVRPEQAELEGEDGAGDGADGESDGHRFRPALGQLHRDRIVVAEPYVVGDQDRRPGRPRRGRRG